LGTVFWREFLFCARDSSLFFSSYIFSKNRYSNEEKNNVLLCGWLTKIMTKNRQTGWRAEQKKIQGELHFS